MRMVVLESNLAAHVVQNVGMVASLVSSFGVSAAAKKRELPAIFC